MPFSEAIKRNNTPAALGYRMPAEWAPHQATWISWPHNLETWPGVLDRVEIIMARAVEALSSGEVVRINVLDEDHRRHVESLIDREKLGFPVQYHLIPTNDAWCRDHGAIFLTGPVAGAPLAATTWEYNAWGGKYPPFDLDNAVAGRMADALDAPAFSSPLILEGGSIEVNGAGVLLSTQSCLLNPNRNPDRSQGELETALREAFGIRRVIWLEGDVAGDDTDGHIDNLVRFVREDTVLAAVESDPLDVNFEPLQDNLNRLRASAAEPPDLIRIVELPMPQPVVVEGNRLPASYANFYIGNRVILMPGYGGRNDDVASDLLQSHFPERRVVTLDCSDVVVGLGAFHCLTQQVPAIRKA